MICFKLPNSAERSSVACCWWLSESGFAGWEDLQDFLIKIYGEILLILKSFYPNLFICHF